MADITDLLDHAGEVRPPALAELERVADRRRGRAVVVRTVAVAAAVAVVLLAVQPLGARDATPTPIAPDPTPSEPRRPDPNASTPPPDSLQGPFPTLTPEEIRNHPDAAPLDDHIPVAAAPGVAARLWSVCLADCSRATTHQAGELQRALEVTRDDFRSSAVYPYDPPEPNVSHVLDDWFAMTSFHGGVMVNARGDRRPLTLGASVPAVDIAGPLVRASSGVAYVDLETSQLHELEGNGYWEWDAAGDTWYWGAIYATNDAGRVLRQGLTWRNADGTYGATMLAFDDTEWSTQMLRSGIPGTMGAIEPGPVRLLHVTTDFGATWDVRVLPESWGTGTWVPDDWRSWTVDWPSWSTP